MIGTPKDIAIKKARAAVRLATNRPAYTGDERMERTAELLNRVAELLLAMTSRPDLDDP